MKSMHEMLAAGQAVSTAAMHDQQARALNPALKDCGTLPECRGCTLLFGAEVIGVAERVAPAINRADLT
ncbi:hypothetical protein HYV64_00105 [Candidatus Shapirobacteria bacterium]|nr:hypothetical protein [Candidatus Shapirobacteria bacterium]